MDIDIDGAFKVFNSRRLAKAKFDERYSYICMLCELKAGEDADSALEPVERVKNACNRLAGGDKVIEAYFSNLLRSKSAVSADKLVAEADARTMDVLASAVQIGPLPHGDVSNTPWGIVSLALGILKPLEGERVIDCGSGIGSFLATAARDYPGASYSGVELDPTSYVLAKLKSQICGLGIDYVNDDVFSLFEKQSQDGSYDKAFSNYPWGIPAARLCKGSAAASEFDKVKSGYNRPVSGDWVFNRLLVDAVKDDGLAVGIMTSGSAFNSVDAKVRQHFIEQGWIKAAITLPEGVFAPYTGIGTTVIVLGHNNFDGVRLVDATDLGKGARRQVSLGDDDVEEILARLGSNGEHSCLLSVAELSENDYNLYAPRYLCEKLPIPNPAQLGDVIENMTRGAALKADELDELTCTEDTGISYLGLSDIQDGMISERLSNLESLDPKYEKYCVKNGDLLISKTGAQLKVAVAELAEGRKVLACSNLYVVRLSERIDPYYLAAYLSSTMGAKEVSMAAKGTLVKTLNASDLKQVTIPLEPADQQQKVAAIYRAKLDEIQVYKLKLEKARAEVADIFSEEG